MYHKDCLSKFYNSYRKFKKEENKDVVNEINLEDIALIILISLVSAAMCLENISMIITLAEIVKYIEVSLLKNGY